MSRDPPFFAGSILGLRAWTVEARLPSSATRLGAAVADTTWEPGGAWTEAACRPLGEGRRGHRAPRPGCSCGLYALHLRPQVATRLYSEHVEGEVDPDRSDPRFIETVGVFGLVEASGRIEIHESGFRAERARPVALVAGRTWPLPHRQAVEELASLYGAAVLEVGSPRELLAFAEERGGALSEEQVSELLPEPEPPATPSPVPTPSPAPSAPPSPSHPDPPASWLARTWGWVANAAVMVAIGVFGILWYGTIAAFVVGIAGGILFGWFEEESRPPPAKVLAVQIDRERCVISATVRARRKLDQLNLVVEGNLRNGDSLGTHNFKLGPIPRGRSRQVVARPDPRLCRSRHHFTLRVRPKWRAQEGNAVQATSRFKGAVRKPSAATTQQVQ